MQGRKVGIVIVFVLFQSFLINQISYSQRYWEAGFSLGSTYYLGDINHSRHFYSPGIAGGGFLRYTFTQRWQVRLGAFGGVLSGDDLDFNNEFQQLRAHSFSTPVVDVTGQVEFNFKPFKLTDPKKRFSPYVYTGTTFFIATFTPQPYQMAIPMGVGLKVNFLKTFTFSVDWGFRKTFTDEIDKLTWYKKLPFDQISEGYVLPKQTGYYKQKDWYSVLLFSLSFKLYSYDRVCLTYTN